MLVQNNHNLVVANMFLMYTIITEKSLIKQKKIASLVKDGEEVNFIQLKTSNIQIIDIQIDKTLNSADLTSLEVGSMEGASFKDMKIAYPKLCLKIVVK